MHTHSLNTWSNLCSSIGFYIVASQVFYCFSSLSQTQVSVRGRVLQQRRSHGRSTSPSEGGNIELLTTSDATSTYQQHLSPSAGDNDNITNTNTDMTLTTTATTSSKLGDKLHVSSSITWSPLPPRRTTAAAAQSLCVTLFCDDKHDDITNITSKIVTDKMAEFKAQNEQHMKLEIDQIDTSCLDEEDIKGPSVFSVLSPYVPLDATPSLKSRNENILNAGTPDFAKVTMHSSKPPPKISTK